MLITATCGSCQKRYKVDAALAGKKAKCKACGASFVIPSAAPQETDVSDDLMAGLMAATESEQKPAARAQPSAPAARKPTPPAKKSSALEGVEDDFGEVDLAPPKPSGAPASAAPRRPAPSAVASQGRPSGPAPVRKVQRVVVQGSAKPLRPTEEHQNKFLAWLDGTIMQVGQGVFWLMVLYILFMSIALVTELHKQASSMGATVPGKVYAISLLGMPLLLLIWTLGQVPLTTLAAKLASMVMKFELPEEPRWRVLNSQMVALSYVLIGWAVATLVIYLRDTADLGVISACLRGLLAVPFLALITIPLSVPTHFFATWLLLRLKFTEAIVAWLFQCVSMFIFGAILTGISLVVMFLVRVR